MPVVLYRSWRDFPSAEWLWPSFSPEELACRGTGQLVIDEPSLDKLQALRNLLGVPMIVHSAYRSPEHNKRVGGAKHSQHLYARAYDISMSNHDPEDFEAKARSVGFTGFGYYPKQGFMHIDTGPARSWGTKFPPRPVTLPVETAPDEGEEAPIPADRFRPEPPKPTIIETIAKPEIIGPAVGTGVTGILATIRETLANSLPLQIALAVLIIAIPIGLGAFLLIRARRVRTGD